MKIKYDNTVNESEKQVSAWGDKVFLGLWSHPNLYRKNKAANKEICDLLVIFGETAIIFSIKDIGFGKGKSEDVLWKKWHKTAIKKGLQAVNGAHRHIHKNPENIFYDKHCTKPIIHDVRNIKKVYKVSVSFGCPKPLRIVYSQKPTEPSCNYEVNLPSDDIVHVFNEKALEVIQSDIDTVQDFCSYLEEKEALIKRVQTLEYACESDLIARFFLEYDKKQNKYGFTKSGGDVSIAEGEWAKFSEMHEYELRKSANKHSYHIDAIIQNASDNVYDEESQQKNNCSSQDLEAALRQLAMLSRLERRYLSDVFKGAVQKFQPMSKSINSHRSYFQMGGVAFNLLQLDYDKSLPESEVLRRRLICLRESTHALAAELYFSNIAEHQKVKTLIGIAIYSPRTVGRKNHETLMFLDMASFSKESLKEFQDRNNALGDDRFWQNISQYKKIKANPDFPQPTLENIKELGDYDLIFNETEDGLEVISRQNQKKESRPHSYSRKTGRNGKCPCGSGKKYKKCCLP